MANIEKKKPQHAPIVGFPVQDGELTIGGIPVSRLAKRVGATPFTPMTGR